MQQGLTKCVSIQFNEKEKIDHSWIFETRENKYTFYKKLYTTFPPQIGMKINVDTPNTRSDLSFIADEVQISSFCYEPSERRFSCETESLYIKTCERGKILGLFARGWKLKGIPDSFLSKIIKNEMTDWFQEIQSAGIELDTESIELLRFNAAKYMINENPGIKIL